MAGKGIELGQYAPRDVDATLSVLLRVDAVADGRVSFHPEGGGFRRSMAEETFASLHRPVDAAEMDRLRATWSPVPIVGDWFEPGAEPMPAWGNGALWNGWAMPLFERQPLLDAIADGRLGAGPGMASVFYHEPADAFVVVDGSGETVPDFDRASVAAHALGGTSETVLGEGKSAVEVYLEACPATTIETAGGPVRVYGIGTGSWCWQIAPEPESGFSP